MTRSTFGSVRNRGKNVWELRYTVNHKRHSEAFRGTKKQAEDRLAEIRFKTTEGKHIDITIDQFANQVWLSECESRVEDGSLSPTTYRSYKQQYNHAIKPVFGDVLLSKLTGDAVQDWLLTMSAGAAAHAKGILRIIMRRACDLDYVDSHPMDKRYIMPQQMTTRRRTDDIYTYQELIDLADELYNTDIEACYLLAAFGGGLLSEVCGVRVDECEYKLIEDKYYFVAPINRTVHWIDREVVIKNSTKTEYRQANLLIEEPYSTRLNAILGACIEKGDTYLTDDGFGFPIDPTVVQRLFKKHFECSSIPYIPFSNLRNAYSTHLHERGLDASTVSKLMRHSNLQTDYKHYNRPTDEVIAHQLGLKIRGKLGDSEKNPVGNLEEMQGRMVRPAGFEPATAGLEVDLLRFILDNYDLIPKGK